MLILLKMMMIVVTFLKYLRKITNTRMRSDADRQLTLIYFATSFKNKLIKRLVDKLQRITPSMKNLEVIYDFHCFMDVKDSVISTH